MPIDSKHTKKCPKCQQVLSIASFNRKGEGFSCYCKSCNKKYLKDHYKANQEYYREKSKKLKRSIKEFIKALKDQPCTDCKKVFPYVCMDFDHTGKKSFNIAAMVQRKMSIEAIKVEMSKCELVCANCHRIRTARRLEIF